MTSRYPPLLDATALAAYVDGQVAVGELIAEVADEGRQVAVPATFLAAAHASVTGDVGAALLALLTSTPAVTVVGLGTKPGVDDVRQVGVLARAAGGDVALGHAGPYPPDRGSQWAIGTTTVGDVATALCKRCSGRMPLLKRSDAQFCSRACRSAAARDAKRPDQAKARGPFLMTCVVCGTSWDFDECRPEKVYCSKRCRTRAWRRRLSNPLLKVRPRRPQDPQA